MMFGQHQDLYFIIKIDFSFVRYKISSLGMVEVPINSMLYMIMDDRRWLMNDG